MTPATGHCAQPNLCWYVREGGGNCLGEGCLQWIPAQATGHCGLPPGWCRIVRTGHECVGELCGFWIVDEPKATE